MMSPGALEPVFPAPPVLQGFIDDANAERVSGWVCDPRQPNKPITLELVTDDRTIAIARADGYRADLEQAGIGNGHHAFLFLLRATPLPHARNEVQLRCAETGAAVPGSPFIIEREGAISGADAKLLDAGFGELVAPAAYRVSTPANASFGTDGSAKKAGAANASDADADAGAAGAMGREQVPTVSGAAAFADLDIAGYAEAEAEALPGRLSAAPRRDAVRSVPRLITREPAHHFESPLRSNIDFADWTGIRGWVWDPESPDRRVELELLDGDNYLATIVASDFREDLEQAKIGDGRHGFVLAFSETLLPFARHELHLRSVGSKFEIPTFPLILTREQTGFDPSVMRFILSNVLAETARAQKPEDLSALITSLVEMIDQTLAYYFELAGDAAAAPNPTDLLSPQDFAPQLQTLIESIQQNYPTLSVDNNWEPIVSIIIPVYNKFDLTYNCVKSLIEHGAEIPFEIIIVDDCSRDETVLGGLVFGRGIRLVRNSANVGFIRSCNRGFDAANGEYVVFLNNDTEVKARWLDELYETIQRDPKIGIVGSKLLFPDGNLQECGGIIWRMGDGWNWGRGEAADDPRFSYMRDADYVSGAALMLKSRVFVELGKFDEYYLPAYYEDTDLCFRARQHNYRVVVQPVSEVIHFEGASAGTSTTGTGMKRFQAINHRKFFDRWRDVLATHRFNGELPGMEAERNVRQRALFIDDSVPEPDKDAGSNAAFQHMLSLQRLGYKVTFIPGDNMARIDPYTSDLQRRGIECLYHPYFFSVEDVFRKQQAAFELIYLHRYSNASKYAGMVRQHFPQARILYNVADLHFLRTQRRADVENDPKLRERADQLRRLELGAMSFVDCVIVHSDTEAALLKELAPDVEVQVIPWTVSVRDISKTAAPTPGIAFIGGYRHPPNVDAAVWAAHSIMPPLRRQVPGIELLLVGSHMPAEITNLTAKDIVPIGYVPSLDSIFSRVRLTVAPLRYGAGLKGKVLESLAAGIPCVMTPVAAEGVNLPEKLQSLVSDDPDILAARIASLCQDDAEYQEIAEAGKAHISANYSPERIDALIREACAAE
ncbi:MAG TPA: glycosyltransferase [Stellaceae bacterium]|nr:glycosyltransferase [Stellaceae bacterium]